MAKEYFTSVSVLGSTLRHGDVQTIADWTGTLVGTDGCLSCVIESLHYMPIPIVL